MNLHDANVQCPTCHVPMLPKVLVCDACGIKVEGPFQLNEFAVLPPEDLHFLRIFIRSEGRIREMEAALGLSYPTIRSRLTALKNRVFGLPEAAEAGRPSGAEATSAQAVLERLQQGAITFEEALQQLKSARKGP